MLDIQGLRQELLAAGLFERVELRTWGKLFLLLVAAGGMITAHIMLPLWASPLLLPFTSLILATIAILGHEGGHRALSRSRFRNELMYNFCFPLFSGLGGLYWKWKHNLKHHGTPNLADHDPDIKLWPMASTSRDYNEAGPAQQWFMRNCQGFMFWPLTFMLSWSMRASSVIYMVNYVREQGIDRKWLIDAACMVSHLVLWVVIPTFIFGWIAVPFYLMVWTPVGFILAAIFSPAHMSMPVLGEYSDRWSLQLYTTRNLTMPSFMSFFFIGLDHQVEHHLFPRIPHQHMKKAAVITQRWAARQGAPYYSVDYFKGMADVTTYMGVAWKLDPLSEDDRDAWDLQRAERDLAAELATSLNFTSTPDPV